MTDLHDLHPDFNELPATGKHIGEWHYYPIRVYVEDTDVTGYVFHGNHLRYMERARTELLRLAGIEQSRVMESKAEDWRTWVVHSLDVRYISPARLDDCLVVKTRTLKKLPASLHLHQIIQYYTRQGDVRQISDARIRLASIGRDGKPRRYFSRKAG